MHERYSFCAPLVVIVSMGAGVIHSPHIHYQITVLQQLRVPGSSYPGITILWEHLEHVAGQGFITVESTIVSANGFRDTSLF